MDDRREDTPTFLAMEIASETVGKYPKDLGRGCGAAFGYAITSSIVGGVVCLITNIIGEGILELGNAHTSSPHHSAFLNLAKMGFMGGAVANLSLYALIVIYACKFDPKRNKPSEGDIFTSGWELVGFRPSRHDDNTCLAVLGLLSFHAMNMLLSGTVGYWIYTRNNKNIIHFQGSMESLCVGIAVTTIPFSVSNLFLLTAYSNFKIPEHLNRFTPIHTPSTHYFPQREITPREQNIALMEKLRDKDQVISDLERRIRINGW